MKEDWARAALKEASKKRDTELIILDAKARIAEAKEITEKYRNSVSLIRPTILRCPS